MKKSFKNKKEFTEYYLRLGADREKHLKSLGDYVHNSPKDEKRISEKRLVCSNRYVCNNYSVCVMGVGERTPNVRVVFDFNMAYVACDDYTDLYDLNEKGPNDSRFSELKDEDCYGVLPIYKKEKKNILKKKG